MPGVGRGQWKNSGGGGGGRRGRGGGGGNQWQNNSNNFNQSAAKGPPPRPLLQTQISPPAHYANQNQNQIDHQQQFRQQQQQQQFRQQQQQQQHSPFQRQQQQQVFVQPQAQSQGIGTGTNQMYRGANPTFNIQGQSQLSGAQNQMQLFALQQQAMAYANPNMNQEFRQQVTTQSQPQQTFVAQNYLQQQVPSLVQQQPQTVTQQGQLFNNQQQLFQQQQQMYNVQQQQSLQLQQQTQQPQQAFTQQQQSLNQQWLLNPASQIAGFSNIPATLPNLFGGVQPPLPPTPAPPPPPVSLTTPTNPPPPPEEPKSDKHDLGRIRSTNLPGLLEIIAGKSKDGSKIPGLDLEPAPSPIPKQAVEVGSDSKDETKKIDEATNSETTGNKLQPPEITIEDDPPTEPPVPVSVPATAVIVTQSESEPVTVPPVPVAPIIDASVTSGTSSDANGGITASNAPVFLESQSAPVPHLTGTDQSSTVTAPSNTGENTNTTKGALLAFDKKFREWEKQFEDWKKSSSGHPDKVAYRKYLAQWESMREQLVQQRRFIIENINKDRGDMPSASTTASLPLKNWNSEAPTFVAPNPMTQPTQGIENASGNQFNQFNAAPLQNVLPQTSQIDTSSFPAIDAPKHSQPATKDPYEIRDLSKLIQNPFAVTGGPIPFEQRRFLQPQQMMTQIPPQHSHSQGRGSLHDNSLDTRGSGGRPESPVHRVSRTPHDDNHSADLSDDYKKYEPDFENEKFSRNIDHRNRLQQDSFQRDQYGSRRPPFDDQFHQDEPQEMFTRNKPSNYGFQNASHHGGPLSSSRSSDSFQLNRPSDTRSGFTSQFGNPTSAERENRNREDFLQRPADEPSTEFEFSRRDDIGKTEQADASGGPVTFDYGHGSNPIAADTEAMFSRDRNVGSSFLNKSTDDDNEPVTFDYGHGTTSPVPVASDSLMEPPVEEDLDSYHDRYQDPPNEPVEEEYYFHGPPPFYHDDIPPHDWGFHGGRGMFRGRGMPPMRGFPPGRPPFRPPYPGMYYDDFGYPYPPGPRFRPPFFRGPGPRFFGPGPPPPEAFYPPDMHRPSRPLFPITEFERPARIAPPPEAEIIPLSTPELRQAPPRDLEPISPEGSPKGSSNSGDSKDRGRTKSRNERERQRSSSRDKERSSDRSRRHIERRSEREVSPVSRRRHDSSPRPRIRRNRSRSRSPRERYERERDYRRTSPVDRRGFGGRRSSPTSSSRPMLIEEILNLPGRKKRPSQIVIVLRGLPGSGKTHVAKLIKDRETEFGDSAPRILSLDDYFMTGEVKKTVKDPVTGKETKESVSTYEYDADLENGYRNDMFKTFRKTIEAGYFRFIILDCVNDKFKHFQEMTNFAKAKRFQVYVVEMEGKAEECAKRNIHNRTLAEIKEIERNWERTPYQFTKLDVRNLLQDQDVINVEMEDVSDEDNLPEGDTSAEVIEIEDEDEPWATSKWETSEDKLNKLDGLAKRHKNADSDEESEAPQSLEKWLQMHVPDDYSYRRDTQPGKKRVRWADIEARREQERAREIGFVVGHTDWSQVGKDASSALTRTKYI